MKYSSRKSKSNKKPLVITMAAIVAVLLIGGGVFAYQKLSHHNSSSTTTTTTNSSAQQSASSPSTDQEGATSIDKTNDTGNQSTSNSSSSANPATSNVDVVITSAGQFDSDPTNVEVHAYANVLQDGTCTYSFTQGSTTLAPQTSSATTGPSTTTCAPLSIPASNFPQKGQWNLTVTYQSTANKYTGKATQTITVK